MSSSRSRKKKGQTQDFITIKISTLLLIALPLAFVLGTLAGFMIWGLPYTEIEAEAHAWATQAANAAAAPAGGAAPAQPTELPARVEDVSEDDDPS